MIAGQVVTGCHIRNRRLRLPIPDVLGERIVGQRLLDVRRRAKYLLLMFGHGAVVVHLGMSGSLRVLAADTPAAPHEHVDLQFGDWVLRLRDPRRFGLVVWHDGDVLEHPLLARLGPEPLEDGFDGKWLLAVTRGACLPVKQALMDARRVVGVGNIYASESLFRAGIHPLTAAGAIGVRRYERLVAAVRDTLAAAIEAGGSTLRDYVGGDGRAGYFQQQYAVYGRAGQPCRVCGSAIQRAVVGQRSTFWCPRCQRR